MLSTLVKIEFNQMAFIYTGNPLGFCLQDIGRDQRDFSAINALQNAQKGVSLGFDA
jgi:hypothetical protein